MTQIKFCSSIKYKYKLMSINYKARNMKEEENKRLELWDGVGDELWNVLGALFIRITLDAVVIDFFPFNLNMIITCIF